MKISDTVNAKQKVNIVSRLHLHPHCRIESTKNKIVTVAYPAGTCKIKIIGPDAITIENSYYCPQFGIKLKNQTICVAAQGTEIATGFHLTDDNSG